MPLHTGRNVFLQCSVIFWKLSEHHIYVLLGHPVLNVGSFEKEIGTASSCRFCIGV